MQAQISDDPESGFGPSVALLKALADPTRLRLVWALTREELPVSRLAELAGAQVAAVSQHLARLREAGVVASRRDGTRIFYRLASEQVARLLDEVALTATRLEMTTPEPAGTGQASPEAAGQAVTRVRPVAAAVRPRLANG
ncbi:ArsR/SmtB family transcription factor [Rhizomonospora bruguierae]|uniref:ArsR/SmtB family transcription factor n=1 Tax=Rhizomonospora bruguierae TaxID=1581705 RepID=UPI001BCB6A96|nr:metalloregulator ArsR/SmtB family transcription factor [Micromonospora sp. NBRC 107566]